MGGVLSPREASLALLPYMFLLICMSQFCAGGRGRGRDRGRWVSWGSTASRAATLNMGIWSVECDLLRVENSTEAADNGFLGGLRDVCLPHFWHRGGGTGTVARLPDPSLPGEVCHPACSCCQVHGLFKAYNLCASS